MKKLYAYLFLFLMFCTGCGTSAPEEVQEPIASIPVTESTTEPEIETAVPETEKNTEKISQTMLHGYNENENTTLTFAGLNFSIPSYWGEANQKEDEVTYSIRETSSKTDSDLTFYNWDIGESFDQAKENKDILSNYFMTEILSGIGTEENTRKDLKIDGMEAQLLTYTLTYKDFSEWYTALTTIYNEETQRVIGILLCESVDSKYDFYDDYTKIIGHITKSEVSAPISVEETNPLSS